jgi:stress response protein SCP2/5-methylcytosine-specific restriction endonuclease McrA
VVSVPSAVLVRGANTVLTEVVVAVTVSWEAGTGVDPCALLLAADGKVGGEPDFVFYNQPEHPSGAVRLSETEHTASLALDLARIPRGVDKVVIAGSVDRGTFDRVPGLQVAVTSRSGRVMARFLVTDVEPVSAIVFGEVYRRGDEWKFRAVGQGWAAGLAGLVTHFGIEVSEERPPSEQAGWYPRSDEPGTLRWWNGTAWTAQTTPIHQETADRCGRCGGGKLRPTTGGAGLACPRCPPEIASVLANWLVRARDVLAESGPTGERWTKLWEVVRHQRVPDAAAQAALRPVAIAYLQQLVTFAFADDLIEQHEVDGFEAAVAALGIADPMVGELRAQLRRGLELGVIIEGDVPRIEETSLHLDATEFLHLDTPAAFVKILVNGPRKVGGRLIATSRKVMFISDTGSGGSQVKWDNVVEIRHEYGGVIISVSTAKGGGTFEVADPPYVSAVLRGTMRIARRQVSVPRQRDTRSIPNEVKAEVWRRDGGACVECEANEFLEFDLVIPWSRGGATSVANLQLLCRRCNLAKGARI